MPQPQVKPLVEDLGLQKQKGVKDTAATEAAGRHGGRKCIRLQALVSAVSLQDIRSRTWDMTRAPVNQVLCTQPVASETRQGCF